MLCQRWWQMWWRCRRRLVRSSGLEVDGDEHHDKHEYNAQYPEPPPILGAPQKSCDQTSGVVKVVVESSVVACSELERTPLLVQLAHNLAAEALAVGERLLRASIEQRLAELAAILHSCEFFFINIPGLSPSTKGITATKKTSS